MMMYLTTQQKQQYQSFIEDSLEVGDPKIKPNFIRNDDLIVIQ